MKDYGTKNFALGAARKVMASLGAEATETVIEYGPALLDAEQPEGKWVAEFNINRPFTDLSEADQLALAECRVIVEAPEERRTMIEQPDHNPPVGDAVQPPAPETQPGLDPAPATVAAQRTTELQGFDGRMVTADVPKAAGRKGLAVRNGATQPAVGTMARMIWDRADEMAAERKRPILSEELRADLLPKGFAASSISQQYSAWCKFWEVSDEAIKAIEEAMAGPEREALNARKAEEKRVKDEIKAAEKAAHALEIAARKEAKKAEREAAKAAKAQGKEAENAAKDAAKAQEAKAKLEERLAKNIAIAEERARAQAAKAEERRKQAEERARLRMEDFQKRQREAQARLDALRAGLVTTPPTPLTDPNAGGETPSTDSGEAEAASGAGTDPDQSESPKATA